MERDDTVLGGSDDVNPNRCGAEEMNSEMKESIIGLLIIAGIGLVIALFVVLLS